jgi:hypothetical protein
MVFLALAFSNSYFEPLHLTMGYFAKVNIKKPLQGLARSCQRSYVGSTGSTLANRVLIQLVPNLK